jgi:hypothetical protein
MTSNSDKKPYSFQTHHNHIDYIIGKSGTIHSTSDIISSKKLLTKLLKHKKRLLRNTYRDIVTLYTEYNLQDPKPYTLDGMPQNLSEIEFMIAGKWLELKLVKSYKEELESLKSTVNSSESSRMKALLIYALSQLEQEQPNIELVTAILKQARDSDD